MASKAGSFHAKLTASGVANVVMVKADCAALKASHSAGDTLPSGGLGKPSGVVNSGNRPDKPVMMRLLKLNAASACATPPLL